MAQDDIQGTVVDASGNPISGAIVELTRSYQSNPTTQETVVRTTTDANGNYIFEAHPDGNGTTLEYHVSCYNHDGTAYVNSENNPGVTADLSAIPDSGVLLYRFDDNSDTSTAIDDIGANDGVITGASYDSNASAGAYALSFDGVDDYVEVPASDLIPGNGDFTVIMDSQPNGTSSNQIAISNNNDQAGRWDLYVSLDSAGGVPYFFADNLSSSLSGTTTLSTSEYYKLALRRSGDTWDLIVDDGTGATVVDSITEAATLDTSVNYQIGNYPKNDESVLSGLIDEPYIDNSALSLSEIENHPYE